jgi:hypothetical protein
MLDLPFGIQRHCVQYLDIKALKSLRTTNKAILPLSTEKLFHTISLFPGQESSTKFTHVLENTNLNPMVRKIIFDTSSPADKKLHCEEEKKVDEDFQKTMCTVGKFLNLCEVELRFSRECAHENDYRFNKEVQETVNFRTNILENLFKALNNPENPTLKVDSLTINNLQDHTTIYDNENFIAVRSRLKKLALNIATESDDTSPERSIRMVALHEMFNNDLLEQWLKPLQDQLTHLTIYCDTYWGAVPYCDLRQVHFPHLKSLSMGNFTIVHNWQIDWILLHGPTLEELLLDDCPITIALNLEAEQCRPNFPELISATEDTDLDSPMEYVKDVSLRWHDIIPRFQTDLPHLKRFAMGSGNWDRGLQFQERYEMVSELRLGRYNIFDCGIGPSHWADFEYDNRVYECYTLSWGREEIKFPDCDEQDLEALGELMEVVNFRARG